MTLTPSVLDTILKAGISASSADNCQPWIFEPAENQVKLFINQQELGKFFDPGLAATLISCGGVCELMRIAASMNGLDATIHYDANCPNDAAVAEVRFSNSDAGLDPLSERIFSRCVHRGHYRRWKSVSREILEEAEQAIAGIDGTRVVWLDSQQRRKAANLALKTDAIRFSHPVVHEQFYELLRFGAEADRLRDGLAGDTLGIERIFVPVLKAMRPWSRAAALNRFGWHYVMATRGAWVPCFMSAGLGAMVADRNVDYFTAGRALHRLWIALNGSGLAFQPLGALPLFLMRMDDLHGEGFDSHHQRQLTRMADALPSIIDGFGLDSERLIMLFRYGYPFRPIARARRHEIGHFLRPASN
jgi:hypothetical protein